MSTSKIVEPTTRAGTGREAGFRSWARVPVVAAAVAVPLGIWALARPMGVDVESPRMGEQAPTAIGAGQIVLAALAASLAGWGLLALLEWRWPTRASVAWGVVAGGVFVGSLAPVLTGEGLATATRVVLVLLHAAVAGVVAVGLLRTTPRGTTNADALEKGTWE